MREHTKKELNQMKAHHLVMRGKVYIVRRTVKGKEKRISTGCTDLKLAIRKAIEINDAIDHNKHGWTETDDEPAPTVQEWYDETYDPTYLEAKAEKTAAGYRIALRRFVELFSARPLDSLIEADFVAYRVWREGKPRAGEKVRRAEDGPAGAPNTIRLELTLISGMFKKAVVNGIIEKNPVQELERPDETLRNRVLTRAEQAPVFARLSPEYERLGVVFLGTGLRANELLRLEEPALDFDAGFIRLPAAIAKRKKARDIPIYPDVAQALREQLKARKAGLVGEFGGAKRRKNRTAIFNMGREAAIQMFQGAAADEKIPSFTLHDLRRSFGTRMAEGGCPIKHLSEIMGHATIEITAKYYVHLNADNLKRTMLRIDIGLSVHKAGQVVEFPKQG